jgi:hypothetical protein
MQTFKVTMEDHGCRFMKLVPARNANEAMRWAIRRYGGDGAHVVSVEPI